MRNKKLIKCFNKYGLEFNSIWWKKNETANIPVLQKGGVYKLNNGEFNKAYLRGIGHNFKFCLAHHKRCESSKTTDSLYATHFIVENFKLMNPLENF